MQFKTIIKKVGHNPCFKMMPTVFLSLFLIITVSFLTGMSAIFPKREVEIYDEEEKICKLHTVKSNYDEIIKDVLFSYKAKPLEGKDYYTVREEDNGCEIKIKRGFNLNVNLPGRSENVEVARGSKVLDVLKDLDVEMAPNLYVTPDLEEIVEPSTKIDVVKVERKNSGIKKVIFPYEKKIVLDNSLAKGEKKLKQKGVAGEKETWFEEIYANGSLIKKESKEKIIKPAVEEIVVIGDKKVNENNSKEKNNEKKRANSAQPERFKSTKSAEVTDEFITINGVKHRVKKKISGRATAYAARGRTARMGNARRGIVAANPKVLPYNTKVYIPGYGFAVVGDYCGAACKGKVLVDVCLDSIGECRAWGNKGVTVYILE